MLISYLGNFIESQTLTPSVLYKLPQYLHTYYYWNTYYPLLFSSAQRCGSQPLTLVNVAKGLKVSVVMTTIMYIQYA